MSIRSTFCLGLAPLILATTLGGQSSTYWPSQKWRTATPESQGIDSDALAAALSQVSEKHLGVHSLLVIRHGYAVVDATVYPYDGTAPHDLASVTKTVTSVLTGVAVAQKLIKLDQPLLPLFPKESPADADAQKKKITIENMLRMESGLDCGYAPGERELEQMKRSANWVQFALSLPMKYDPGTHSAYCSPGYHLLGSAIGAAAHTSEAEFGKKYLFDPLGIHGVVWADDPQSRNHGWGDSHFFPQDVAKIGYLYLHGGNWDGKQIVPADWIAMSTAPQTGERGGHGAMGYEWNVSNGPNGRQFGGTGRGGQSLIVWPDLDMVVVSMAGREQRTDCSACPPSRKVRCTATGKPASSRPSESARGGRTEATRADSAFGPISLGGNDLRSRLQVSREPVAARQSGSHLCQKRQGTRRFGILRAAIELPNRSRRRIRPPPERPVSSAGGRRWKMGR